MGKVQPALTLHTANIEAIDAAVLDENLARAVVTWRSVATTIVGVQTATAMATAGQPLQECASPPSRRRPLDRPLTVIIGDAPFLGNMISARWQMVAPWARVLACWQAAPWPGGWRCCKGSYCGSRGDTWRRSFDGGPCSWRCPRRAAIAGTAGALEGEALLGRIGVWLTERWWIGLLL